MSARDELARDWAAAFNSDIPVVDYLHAAGYRKPRTITTVEELDALPGETVIRDIGGMIYELDYIINDPSNKWWIETGSERHHASTRIELPATVLYGPEA